MSSSPTKKPRRLSQQDRRQQILASARSAFLAGGASGTRVRDIATEAGITEPVLYDHFDSRADLFQHAVLHPLEDVIDQLASDLDALASQPRKDRAKVFHRFQELSLQHYRHLIPLMAAAQFADPIEGPRLYERKLLQRLRGSVDPLMAYFTGWPSGSMEMDVAVRAHLGVHFDLALESTLSDRPLDVAKTGQELALMFGPGLPFGRVQKSMREDAGKRRKSAPVAATPAKPRKRLARSERQESVKDAAREIFLLHGFAGARTKQIAAKAGITEAFLFRLFASKEHLYEAAVLQPLVDATKALADQIETEAQEYAGAAFVDRFNRATLPFFMRSSPSFVVALIAEFEEGRRFYRERILPHLTSIDRVLKSEPGLIDPRVDPETTRRVLFGATWGLSFDHQHRSYRVDAEAVYSILSRLFTTGVESNTRF